MSQNQNRVRGKATTVDSMCMLGDMYIYTTNSLTALKKYLKHDIASCGETTSTELRKFIIAAAKKGSKWCTYVDSGGRYTLVYYYDRQRNREQTHISITLAAAGIAENMMRAAVEHLKVSPHATIERHWFVYTYARVFSSLLAVMVPEKRLYKFTPIKMMGRVTVYNSLVHYILEQKETWRDNYVRIKKVTDKFDVGTKYNIPTIRSLEGMYSKKDKHGMHLYSPDATETVVAVKVTSGELPWKAVVHDMDTVLHESLHAIGHHIAVFEKKDFERFTWKEYFLVSGPWLKFVMHKIARQFSVIEPIVALETQETQQEKI